LKSGSRHARATILAQAAARFFRLSPVMENSLPD
jgi:hypothetical protein